MKTMLKTVTFTCLSCLSLHAEAATVGLKFSIQATLDNSPEMLIAEERLYQASQSILEERANLLPQVTYSNNFGRSYKDIANDRRDTDPSTDNYMNSTDLSLKVNQHIFNGLISENALGLRHLNHLMEQHRLRVIKSDLIDQITTAYIDIYINNKRLLVADDFLSRLKEIEEIINIHEEEGKTSKTKLKYVSARVAKASQSRVLSENSLKNAIENYNFLTEIRIEPHTNVYIPELGPLKSPEEYYAKMETHNPDYLLERLKREELTYDLKMTKGEYFPTVSLAGEWSETHDNGGEVGSSRNASLMVRLNQKVFDGGNRRARVHKVASQIKEQKYAIFRTQRDIKEEILTAWQSAKAREEEHALLVEEISNNIQVRDSRLTEFSEGTGELVKLMDEEENLFNSRLNKITAEGDIIKRRFTLELLSGEMDIDSIFKEPYMDPTDTTLLAETQNTKSIVDKHFNAVTPLFEPEMNRVYFDENYLKIGAKDGSLTIISEGLSPILPTKDYKIHNKPKKVSFKDMFYAELDKDKTDKPTTEKHADIGL